jgi:hypothetical protein
MVSLREQFPEDQVVRKEEFQAEHPEWHFISPTEPRGILRGQQGWKAVGPGGQAVEAGSLGPLIDQLEARISGSGQT